MSLLSPSEVRAQRRERAEAEQHLARLLRVRPSLVRPLVRAGVRELADMALWELADLEAVPQVGTTIVDALLPALRAVGIDLPGDSLWPPRKRAYQ